MTVSLYARRKGWPLEGVEVDVSHQGDGGEGRKRIELRLSLDGDLTAEQQARLRAVSRRCPVHRMLDGGAEVVEV
ncbi:MAG TPA: OsmC family protein [Methylomirabilota bacterium]|nr:OsmC family protein [Methylomirabilota bacterium]